MAAEKGSFGTRIKKIVPIIIFSAAVLEVGRLAFSGKKKDLILERDEDCQVCNKERGYDCHHLVPECLENGRHTLPESNGYVEPFYRVYDSIKGTVPAELRDKYKSCIKRRLNDVANGIRVCGICHNDIHRDGISWEEDSILLSPNDNHPERPESLSYSNMIYFLITHIVNPSLKEIGMRPVETIVISEREKIKGQREKYEATYELRSGKVHLTVFS